MASVIDMHKGRGLRVTFVQGALGPYEGSDGRSPARPEIPPRRARDQRVAQGLHGRRGPPRRASRRPRPERTSHGPRAPERDRRVPVREQGPLRVACRYSRAHGGLRVLRDEGRHGRPRRGRHDRADQVRRPRRPASPHPDVVGGGGPRPRPPEQGPSRSAGPVAVGVPSRRVSCETVRVAVHAAGVAMPTSDPVPDSIPGPTGPTIPVPAGPDPPRAPPDYPEIPKPRPPATPFPVHPGPPPGSVPPPTQPPLGGLFTPRPRATHGRVSNARGFPAYAGLPSVTTASRPRPPKIGRSAAVPHSIRKVGRLQRRGREYAAGSPEWPGLGPGDAFTRRPPLPRTGPSPRSRP
jgi:hypothetical protein